MMPRVCVLLFLASNLLAACAESRTLDRPEELDPASRIAELTDAEWESFCQWQEDLYIDRHGAAQYTCEGEELTYDGTAAACVVSGRFGITEDCPLTVDDLAGCSVARVNARCWAAMELRECDIGFCPATP